MNMVFIILNIFLILSSFLSNYFVTLQFAIVNSLALFVTMRFRIGEPTKINVAANTINSVPHGTLFSVFNLSWWIWMRHLHDVNCSASISRWPGSKLNGPWPWQTRVVMVLPGYVTNSEVATVFCWLKH